MKVKKKEIVNIIHVHTCETCGKESNYKEVIEQCERIHICKHEKNLYEFIDANDEFWGFNTKGIEKRCSSCNIQLGAVEFDEVPEEDMPELFELVEKLTKSKPDHKNPFELGYHGDKV